LIALLIHSLVTPEPQVAPDSSMRQWGPAPEGAGPRIAYHDDRPERDASILLIHGSPGGASNFDQLRAELSSGFRVITPDLPGFGSSTRQLENYSFSRHASDLVALLDALEVETVHVVGMSMGGGVALEMVRRAPGRVASVTLLSSIGLQEYELTGDYWTNHILHGAQVVIVWAIDHLVPHFGLLDSGGLAWSYARNFFDSDQRVLTDTIQRWNGPTLVVHGARDFLVPVAASRAHAKAIPQTIYREYADGSHFLIWTRPAEIAEDLHAFLADARAPAAALASVPRPLPTPTPPRGPGRWLILIPAGLVALLWAPLSAWWFTPLIGAGAIGLPELAVAMAAGAALRTGVQEAVRRRNPLRPVLNSGLRALGWFGIILLVGLRVDLRSWTGLVAVAAVVTFLTFARRLRTRLGRARLRGAGLRLRRWEYWPSWAVYLPIVPRLVWRAARMGGVRSVLCVNPAIPMGGLVGESKSAILERMGELPEIPRWTRVEPGPLERRRAEIEAFVEELPEPWPFVIKPDRGERGTGVRIVRTRDALDAALREIRIPVLVQEYVRGEEFGVFWFRGVDADRGTIHSIAHKAMVCVVGDGNRTLEELLADHVRLLPHLDLHRSRFSERLHEVIAKGEEIQVTELGTHALGATFVAANELRTDELLDAIDGMMDSSAFDFGRFDLRVPSAEHLSAGQGLRVIEFNGLSAEAADLYDPDNPLRGAWSGLLHQWTIAMELGTARRRAGARPASWWQLMRALRAHGADRQARGA
jgi:pimeloyl-ACP methyl ester carboxylesterase